MAKHSNLKLNKSLGQHFLRDENVLFNIVKAIDDNVEKKIPIVEVGPGAGALTKFLHQKENFKLVEFDTRWAAYLLKEYPSLEGRIYNEDFLKMDLKEIYNKMAIVGNFPYNISSQILFKVLEHKEIVPTVIGMFQKEVAMRICSKPKSKAYGILSVLIQAYYDAEYLFDVPRESFHPAPKVMSGVLILRRKEKLNLACDEKFFKRLIKMAFQQRRKTLRNSLKQLIFSDDIKQLEIFNKRPEALDVDAFINLTNILDN